MGDAALLRARFKGGQDYVNALCSVVFLSQVDERPRRAPRGLLLAAVLAGVASGVAIACSLDRRRDGGSSRFVEPVLDLPNNQDGEEDALPEAEEG